MRFKKGEKKVRQKVASNSGRPRQNADAEQLSFFSVD